jgi:hypothetical protein
LTRSEEQFFTKANNPLCVGCGHSIVFHPAAAAAAAAPAPAVAMAAPTSDANTTMTDDDGSNERDQESVVLLSPVGATEHKAFTDRSKRVAKRHAATPPTKKVFLAPSYPHTERLLSDFQHYLVASENKPHPHEVWYVRVRCACALRCCELL